MLELGATSTDVAWTIGLSNAPGNPQDWAPDRIVGKRNGSAYPKGRTRDWLKIKTPLGRKIAAKRFEYRR